MAKDYLQQYGHKILDNGYEVVAISPGGKFPTYDYSEEALPRITHKHLDKLLSNGHAHDGVGIRTGKTPLLDLDCPHGGVRRATVQKALDIIGYAPVRIGNAPKLGMMYRTDEPFAKVQSPAFKDPKGRKCQLEFLGKGQQFVAFAIHPDTKKPYSWPEKGKNPARMSWDDLTPVSREQAEELRDFFVEECTRRGWERWKNKKKTTTGSALVPARGTPDEMLGDTDPLGLTIEEVQEWVNRLPNDESVEYEDEFNVKPDVANYRNVIFAIWHETEGSEDGRQIAWDWSEQCPKHEQEEGRFFKLWKSADPKDKEYPVTFRYIIKCVLTIEGEEKKELRDGYLESLAALDDVDDLKELVSKIAKTHFDDIDLGQLAVALRKAAARVGVALSPAQARKMITHKPVGDEVPMWCRPWVYVQHTKSFFNTDSGLEIVREAFDNTFSRYLGGASAAFFVLNSVQCEVYWNVMYNPGAEEEFVFEGKRCINSFSTRLMPPIPETYGKKDRAALKRIQRHARNLIPDDRERGLMWSWFAHIVQTNSRPNWALVIQGVDGDGKSFFGEMMGSVMGGTSNVRKLDPQQLESPFTGWTVGQVLCVIEEIKMHGHSRYDILNKIKPYITNPSINVHPKGAGNYTALNTTAYFCTTNFQDAFPLNDNDRRYCVLASQYQTGEAARQFFEVENPGYFDKLFSALTRAGAIRKWLMSYRLHDEFHPRGRAPITVARQRMIDLAKSDTQLSFDAALEDDRYPRIGRELVVSSALAGHVADETGEVMQTRQVSSFLSSQGYVKLPFRIRIDDGSDNKETIWVRDLSKFSSKNHAEQRRKVLRYLNDRQKELEI